MFNSLIGFFDKSIISRICAQSFLFPIKMIGSEAVSLPPAANHVGSHERFKNAVRAGQPDRKLTVCATGCDLVRRLSRPLQPPPASWTACATGCGMVRRLSRPPQPPPTASWTACATARKGQATGRQCPGYPAKTTPGCLPPTSGLGRGLSVGAKRRRGYHGRASRHRSPPPRPLRPPVASWTAPSTARKGQATGRLGPGYPAKTIPGCLTTTLGLGRGLSVRAGQPDRKLTVCATGCDLVRRLSRPPQPPTAGWTAPATAR